jgi:hypothetical protein
MMIHSLLKDLVCFSVLTIHEEPSLPLWSGSSFHNFHKNQTIFSELKADSSNLRDPTNQKSLNKIK